jgi:hypothetical protein
MALTASQPTTFDELLRASPEQLSGCDIGLMNLFCTQDLPGADVDTSIHLKTLDQWAAWVRHETDRHVYKYRANPAAFRNMEGYYRMMMLVTVLQQDLHVAYNPARDETPQNPQPADQFYADSKDLFLHGVLADKRLGTCCSMPVLYVAVGRRLGYPLKLVATKLHLFVRWESPDGKERFNIEGTNRGMNSHEDDFYKTFPRTLSEEELQSGQYLKSLSSAEELAVFLDIRGTCLQIHGRMAEAKASYTRAHKLVPSSKRYAGLASQKVLTPQ